MENPFVRITQRGLEAMIEAVQEELGRTSQQLVQGMLTPDMLSSLTAMMQQSLGAMGFDMSSFAGMVGQQPGFDPYQILGLDKSATDEEVKKRYNELLKKLHPDTAGVPGTEFLLQMVMAAREMIKRERGWH